MMADRLTIFLFPWQYAAAKLEGFIVQEGDIEVLNVPWLERARVRIIKPLPCK